MGNLITNKSEAVYSIGDYAGLVLFMARQLLQAGGGEGRKLDVSSLAYERAKNNLIDAIALVRSVNFRDVPFFLSHEALLNVKKRLSAQKKLSARAQDLLVKSNHQVFIHNIEDLLDKASNQHVDAGQSKRGYSSDRTDIILKMKSVIADYDAAQRALGVSAPVEPLMRQALVMTKIMRDARENANLKEILKTVGWSVAKIEAQFDGKSFRNHLSGVPDRDIIYLVIQDGKLMFQYDRLRLNIVPQRLMGNAYKSREFVILAKYYIHEIRAGLNESSSFAIHIDHGYFDLRFMKAEIAPRRAITIFEGEDQSVKPRATLMA
ncbi:MAG: hypothetical protein EYC62_04235 [Alphaproteobacteria bacterium]|nr:MAG: hypothetical protein EYC62_04235 [Alphaproteobacteria bacterium]